MNARTLMRFAPMLAGLVLLASIPFAGAAGHEGGKVTIGVPLPQVQLGQGADAAEPLRQSVMSRLQAPGVEVVALAGSSAAEIDADARAKGCSQVLYTRVEQKHGIGGLFSKLAPLAGMLPAVAGAAGGGGGGGGGLTGLLTQTAANAATNAAASAAQKQMLGAQQQMLATQPAMAGQLLPNVARSSIKRGDNISFDYRLVAVGSTAPLRSDTLHAKADADGQDVLTPLTEQLANAVSADSQGGSASAGNPGVGGGGAASTGAGGSTTPPGAGQAEHTGFMHGLFGTHDKSASRSASAAAPAGGGMPDCAQIASMPNAPISLEACQKMAGAQQAYDRALADPSASRPGDEQMSCEQILAELRQQQISAPDKAKAAATTAAATKEQALLAKHIAEDNAIMAEEQAKVDAAAAADQAVGMATGGIVRTNAASAAAEAAQARINVVGKRQAEERRPTEQKLLGGVADLGMDAAQQLATNPRLGRLLQLAQSHGCKGI
jgi:hypothetical protein